MNPKRVLIVDDETVFLLAERKLLQSSDLEVDVAETVEEVRSLLGRHSYDAVIADLRLAGANNQEGLDIIRLVKKQRPATKVILMTAYGNTEVRLKASLLGADMYLEKPVSIEVIRKALANVAAKQLQEASQGEGHG